MYLKRFRGKTVRDALTRARQELGPDALVLSTTLVAAQGWRGVMGAREVEIAAAAVRQVSEVRPERQEDRQPEARDAVRMTARLEAAGFDSTIAAEIGTRGGARRARSADVVRGAVTAAAQRLAVAGGDYVVEVFIWPPGAEKTTTITALTAVQWERLTTALAQVADDFDYLIVDTAAGISDNVIESLGLAQRVLVVTSLEPTAVVDAYAMIKLLSRSHPDREIGVLVNDARDGSEAQLVFAQPEVVATRFLKRQITYYGFIAHDQAVRDAVLVQRPIVEHLPQSSANRCLRILASRLAGMDLHRAAGLRLVTPGAYIASPQPEAPRCA
jgi:MinD-like ATPase involved in chromosome partitioning or flagellar assembly